jgi:diaminohydroxyphosphoribosylaminopyrimidine deaminase/5-amino-6-(5-phosphoribosylamino)uracil reductase
MVRDDRYFMRVALRLARRALGRTSPNPAVGAVVVRRGRIVGRGFTAPPGGPHGEVVALRRAGRRARGATLYVTLEPCAHFGRTPPCVDAVRAAGIARVVIGTRDPNPRVRGDGAGRLRRAAIGVTIGVEQAACEEQIAAFRKHVTTGLPFVTLKLAASLDGRIATASGASKWITGTAARTEAHRLRNWHDAVLIGSETVRRDDPALTCRIPGGRDPLRVVVDSRLRIPPAAQVLTNRRSPGTVVFTSLRHGAKLVRLRRLGVDVVTVPGPGGRLRLRSVLRVLGARGVCSVLVEGGAAVAASALKERLVDQVVVFLAPKLFGGDGRPMIDALGVRTPRRALPLRRAHVRRIGDDFMLVGTMRA